MTILSGVFVNALGVFLAGVLGSFFKRGMPEKIRESLMAALGLCILYVGITGSLKGNDIIVIVLSMCLGCIVGELFDFDKRLNQLGELVKKKLVFLNRPGEDVSVAFVNSTIFVCVGAMSIVGAIESGMNGAHATYYAKALVDSIFIFVMATSLGLGCAFAGIITFLYQGALTLSASFIAQFLNEMVIAEMSCVGGILVIGIALNMFSLTKIKVGNFILAPLMPMLIYPLIKML